MATASYTGFSISNFFHISNFIILRIYKVHPMTTDLIISRLKKRYHPGKFHSPDPFRVLITTVLSQRTRDEVTERASEKLFSKYGTSGTLAKADVGNIEELIREVGFYRVKAPRI